MDLLLGTFNTPTIYTLHFGPTTHTLTITHRNPALGSHSWLALSPSKNHLYATAWLDPPSVVAYALNPTTHQLRLLNQHPVAARSGYVCCSTTHLYSAGGLSGEVFALNPADGSIGKLVQTLNFLDDDSNATHEVRPHGDFGGLRHGAHSVDLSPDGQKLYVADIGRNCIWSFTVNPSANAQPHLTRQRKCLAPRSNDGPRHATPHPNGHVLYSLQEHSSMVDVLRVGTDSSDATTLEHAHGASILPPGKDATDFWADEVRLSNITDPATQAPRYLWASTRGLKKETKGYVGVYALDANGELVDAEAIHIWETPTSGGIANAVEPAPRPVDGVEYAALTDSEKGWVFVVAFDGEKVREVARVRLDEEGREDFVQAATAVWL